MAYAQKFEDLEIWKKARVLTGLIYKISNRKEFSRDFGLSDQIRRASLSTMSNIAEGFDRGTKGDFHRFLSIAKASCAEVRSQIYVAYDVGYLDEVQFNRLLKQCIEVGRIIGGLRNSVGNQRNK